MQFPVKPHWTEEQLTTMRAKSAKEFDAEPERFTCNDCGARRACPFVFDPYNIDGDCLMEK